MQAIRILASLLLLSFGIMAPGCRTEEAPANPARLGEATMPSQNIVNGYDYADLRATSYIPYTPSQAALIVWPKDSAISSEAGQPIGLTAVDDKLLVRYSGFLEIRQRSNANLIWGRDVHFACDIQVRPEGVLTRNFAGFYEIVSFDSKLSQGFSIPFLGERTHLSWVQDNKDEVRFAYASAPIPVHGTEGTPIEAAGNYGRLSPDSDVALWFFQRPGVFRGARVSNDGSKVCLGTYNFIDIFPASAGDNKQVNSLPVEALRALSINHEDRLLIVDEFEEKLRLRCLDLAGAELWSVDLKTVGEITQPPVSAPGERSWIAVGSTIYHYVGRNLIWEYHLTVQGQSFLTACLDNSVLVVCDSLFTRLSEHGQPIINRVFSGKFTCRPLVDSQGKVYLGGTQGLMCLQ